MTMQAGELRLGKTLIGKPSVSLGESGAMICVEIKEDITEAEVDLLREKCVMAVPTGCTVIRRENGSTLISFEYEHLKRVNDAHRDHSLDDDAFGRLTLAANAMAERLGR